MFEQISLLLSFHAFQTKVHLKALVALTIAATIESVQACSSYRRSCDQFQGNQMAASAGSVSDE
ncbi:hypothetical protein O9993_04585 [Vibrio lentus]|nr:hypothetical protein [Vibrio lentus]